MIQVTLPHLSLSMEEGKIARWLVADGAHVRLGQVIVEIETDKAVAEIESPAAGTIRLVAEEGAVVAVDSPLAEIVEADTLAAQSGHASWVSSASPTAAVANRTEPPAAISTATGLELGHDRKHRASPAARRIAKQRGLDLRQTQGSGPGGRIIARDLEGPLSAAKPSLRDAVVAQLEASWREIPHIHIGGELDGSGLASAKRAAPAGVTVTDLLILATVRALREVPVLNGAVGKPSQRVHLALAVATPSGVISPVLRNASDLSIEEIARERSRLVTAARAGASDRRDLAGGTFTLTNLGAFPVDFFAPVVSGPQVAMLATGRLAQRPVAIRDEIVVCHRMWANVAIDHRAADGIAGARFLAALERCLNELPT